MSNYEEMCVWPDYTVCAKEELDDYLDFMSDDYVVIRIDLDEIEDFPCIHNQAIALYREHYELV